MKDSEVPDFLVGEFVRRAQAAGLTDFEEKLHGDIASAAHSAERYIQPLHTADAIYNWTLRKVRSEHPSQEPVIYFFGLKFRWLIDGLVSYAQCGVILGSAGGRLYALRRLMRYIPTNDLYRHIQSYWVDKHPAHLRELLAEVRRRLENAQPDYVIVPNDSLPLERAFILACRGLRITTLQIQDGIYPNDALMHGGAADYVLVWGESTREQYLRTGLQCSERVIVLGYPYESGNTKVRKKRRQSRREVYYFGQNFEKYKADLINVKADTIMNLNRMCHRLGLRFTYRPHPGDDLLSLRGHLPGVRFCPKKESLAQSIERADVCVSFNSTALIEASMQSKTCIQLRNIPMQSASFEDLGLNVRTCGSISQVENVLSHRPNGSERLGLSPDASSDFVAARPIDTRRRLLQIVRDLERQKIEGRTSGATER